MYKMKQIYLTAAGLILATVMSSAQAVLVNFELTGNVDFWADAGNEFGLVLGDTITATGTFDDSVLAGGFGTVDFSSGSGNTLTITAGSMVFTESDDDNFLFGFPTMVIDPNPLFSEMNFSTTSGYLFFDSFFDVFDAEDNYGNMVNGTWDFNSLSITPVPVPAALWLLGSGLIGLAGFAGKRETA